MFGVYKLILFVLEYIEEARSSRDLPGELICVMKMVATSFSFSFSMTCDE